MNREALHRRWIAERGARGPCPYCGSLDTERFGAFGAFHMTEPYICRTCGSPFHRIRWRSPSEVENPERG
ncbi:MAG: PaaD-like zinc ribbon domain-containing protein [Candidatus Eiseniibacteriota bacterium]